MRIKSTAIIFLVLLVGVSAVLAGGCGSGKKAVGSGHIRYALSAEPESIDPRMSTSLSASTVETQLFEGLTTLDEKNRPIAAAAEKWEVSPDGRKYTFTLRSGLKWSNGDPVTAQDFEYAWKSGLDPELASPNAYMLYCLKNGEAFATKKADVTQVGVKAKDDRTLEVELERPTAYFLSLAAFHAYFPVHKKTVAANSKWANQPQTLIGNGPFKLTAWVKSSRMELAKNEHYWDAAKVKSSKLELYLLDNSSTALSMFESGQLDMGDSIPSSEVPRLVKEGKVKIYPFLGTAYVSFHVTKAPFDNPKVRRAFSLAIDRTAITDKLLRGGQTPALSFVPPGIADAGSNEDFRGKGGNLLKDNDIATARSLLAEAGFPDGKGFPNVTFLYNTSESNKVIAEALQEMWKKNLGVQVAVANQEWKVYWDVLDRHDFQMARETWTGDYPDPLTFLDLFVSGGSNNAPDYRNPAYDKLIAEAQQGLDQNQRMQWLHDAEKIIIDEAVVAPVFFMTNPVMIHAHVKGVLRSILGVPYLKEAYLVP
ncbi:MAG TPA: peptide ABC transporter substrate-binding protein [Negativicutes bacterium]|nr:peptide ABC transporter substrate-binding protein [Negativicutes bacterium]